MAIVYIPSAYEPLCLRAARRVWVRHGEVCKALFLETRTTDARHRHSQGGGSRRPV